MPESQEHSLGEPLQTFEPSSVEGSRSRRPVAMMVVLALLSWGVVIAAAMLVFG
jgi:hypothetical protein